VVSTHTVRIDAPPGAVWPWLVQMRYGRAGWYAIDRLERPIGAGDFLVWAFVLIPDGGGTRLTVRTRTAARTGWMRPVVPALDAGHLVMQAVHLRRLRRRVESARPGDVGGDHSVQAR
jgi:hypothetical protein